DPVRGGAGGRLAGSAGSVPGGSTVSQAIKEAVGAKTEVETYRNYIGGKWVPSRTGRTFESTNPAHKAEVLGVLQQSDMRDVDAAIEAASKAFAGWRRTPAPARGEPVLRAASILEAAQEALPGRITRETGRL